MKWINTVQFVGTCVEPLLVAFSLDSNLRNELHMCAYLSPVEISAM